MPKTVVIASKPRKKKLHANRTSFSKDRPNPHAFKPGESGNPGGKLKSDADRLVRKNVLRFVQDPANLELCEAHGLPRNSSYGTILAKRLLKQALLNEQWAVQLVLGLIGEAPGTRLDVFGSLGGSEEKSIMELVFIDGVDGRPSPEFLEAHPDFVMPVPKALRLPPEE
jgi:hypothetical protein